MTLALYNTLTRKKEAFEPIDAKNVRLYVCGPTVYDRPHLGNARSVVVYDVLYRLLKYLYGDSHVTYVRNITDVDDKINAAAKANGEPISALTSRVEGWFRDDMAALNVLAATAPLTGNKPDNLFGYMGEPHATHHIPHMIALIEKLIERGHAYVSQGHALFAVTSDKDYGALSGRRLEELVAGARVEVESYKRHPGDFVLWKPAGDGDDSSSVFDSPWGPGRPGWHIECSAMSTTYLGADFDIHGGGADLMFPHHENEIAQSRCALPGSGFARYWVHNGFLTVGGEKMSKSLGNFTTVRGVLDNGVDGEVIRLALLMSHYRGPLDWNDKLLADAKITLDKFYNLTDTAEPHDEPPAEFIERLCNDLNLSSAISWLLGGARPDEAVSAFKFLGFLTGSFENWFRQPTNLHQAVDESWINLRIHARLEAKKEKKWPLADQIRRELADSGVVLEDKQDGTTIWRRT